MNFRSFDMGTRRVTWILFLGALLITGCVAMVVVHDHYESINEQQAVALFPGFTVSELPSPTPKLVVSSVKSDSEAQHQGIVVGDEVLEIDHHPVISRSGAARLLLYSKNATFDLHLRHNLTPRDVVLHRKESNHHGA